MPAVELRPYPAKPVRHNKEMYMAKSLTKSQTAAKLAELVAKETSSPSPAWANWCW